MQNNNRALQKDALGEDELAPLQTADDTGWEMSDKRNNASPVDINDVKIKPERLRDETDDLTLEEVKCGCGKFKPEFLQYFNNPKALLFFLCCFCMVQGNLSLYGTGTYCQIQPLLNQNQTN